MMQLCRIWTCESPEVTLCAWRGWKPSINKQTKKRTWNVMIAGRVCRWCSSPHPCSSGRPRPQRWPTSGRLWPTPSTSTLGQHRYCVVLCCVVLCWHSCVVFHCLRNSDSFWLSKLDLCEGGSFSPTIFNSDIELSVFPISCFISVCCFVEGNICQKCTHCFV